VTDTNPMTSIQRFFEAENEYFRTDPDQRDIGPLLAELDPDVIVEVPESLPHGGVWRGHSGFEELFAVVARHWLEFRVIWDESKFYQLGAERVMCEGVVQGVLRATGDRVNTPIISLFTFSSAGVSQLDHFYKDTGSLIRQSAESQGSSIEQRLARLEDENAIRQTTIRYAVALDSADWDACERCFTEEAVFDFSDMAPEARPRPMSSRTWVRTFAAKNLTGFTARQHMSANHQIEIDGDRATCRSYAFAQHYLEGEANPLNVQHGVYEHTLVRSGQEWLISSIRMRLWWTDWNLDLFDLAAARLAKEPAQEKSL